MGSTMDSKIVSKTVNFYISTNNRVFKILNNDDDTAFDKFINKHKIINNTHVLFIMYIDLIINKKNKINIPYRCIEEYINKYILVDSNINSNICKFNELVDKLKIIQKNNNIQIIRLTISLIENNISLIENKKTELTTIIEECIIDMNDI